MGRLVNVVAAASGVHIPLREAEAVTFVTFVDAGNQVATIKQSQGGASEKVLDVDVRPYKGPGVGGTWTFMAEQDDTLDLGGDATNDCMVFTVGAEQLDVDGDFDCVEVTVSAGICVALTHELRTGRSPEKLERQVV
ncbi:MAG: hypothetical protein L0H84_00850 [Pseudonocardia sp.]|nr:hypothetical protein [Pseudonocardia sp.]